MAQSPPGCITAAPGATKPPLIDWDVMQEYIMPRKAFFNRYMTVQDPEGKYAVLGFPVLIPHEKYQRNEFIFNFGIVLDVNADQAPYEPVVRRLAVTFKEMEKQNEYLSQECSGVGGGPRGGDRRPIESLLEIVKEDLNNYGECMIPVGEYLCTSGDFPILPPFPLFSLLPQHTNPGKHPQLTNLQTTRTRST